MKRIITVIIALGLIFCSSSSGLAFSDSVPETGAYSDYRKDKEADLTTVRTAVTDNEHNGSWYTPDAVEIDSLIPVGGGVKADWTRSSSESSGYLIRFSDSPDFASCETVNIRDSNVTTYIITWLDPLTEHYFKVRAYTMAEGRIYYSKWSAVKSIITGEDSREAARQRSAEKIWAFGKLSGMTDAQCAGVLGNIKVESDFDPTAVEGIFTEPYYIGPRKEPLFDGNDITPAMESYITETLFGIYASIGLGINQPAYRFPDGRYCAGLGLIQFTGDLAQDLLKFAEDNNKNWYDMDLQIAAIVGGLETTRTRFVQFMNDKEDALTVYGSTGSWFGIMEMGLEAPAFAGIGFEMRFQHAQQWYEKLSPRSFAIAKRYKTLAESAIAMAGID